MKISKLTSIFGSSNTSERMNRFAAGFDSILTLARGLYSSSETLQKIVVKETEAVNRSSSALEEISSMVGKTSSDTNQLNQLTHSAREAVNDGQKAIQEVTHGLHQIQSGTKELSSTLAKRMTELETVTQRLNEIKSKTTLIDDIAFQTKLLAFNASVEAARAGEHGKGFAVVAQEMANLAITSGKASQEISQILATGLSSTNQIVAEMKNQLNALMEKAMKDVEVGIESGSQGAMAFSKIVNEVDSVATLTQSIFQATQEQAIGIKEINFAVHQLSDTSQQLKSVADGTLQSALKLAEQTEEQSKTLPLIANDCGVTLKPIVKPFDFAAAVSAHLDWKMKLTRYLAKPDGSLVPEKVCLDNACALGKWIYGDGQAHKMLPTHESLRTAHASFHQVAADIIKAIDSKQTSQAEKLLAPGGIYMETSERCVGLIKKLQQEVEGGQSKIAA